jgi:hypothetical protein
MIEDDGVSNEATEHGAFTELIVHFRADQDRVIVGASIVKAAFEGSWRLNER